VTGGLYPGLVSLYDLDPGPDLPELVRVIVEIPKDSANKYEYDGELGVFRLDRTLYSPMHYPGDYSFIPGTLADDGDPMDVLVLVHRPSFTGCLIEVRPISLLNMVDQHERDQKIIAVPRKDPRYMEIHTLEQIFRTPAANSSTSFNLCKETRGKGDEDPRLGRTHEARNADPRKPGRLNLEKRASAEAPTEA